jgi:D-alanine transaminase
MRRSRRLCCTWSGRVYAPGMSMIVYLNGRWLPIEKAMVSVEDRGFMFADGVYEVVRYYFGRPLAMKMHLDRLSRGLKALRISLPAGVSMHQISDEVVRRNKAWESAVYWQVTRGAAKRAFTFPPAGIRPTVLAIAYPAPPLTESAPTPVLTAITQPDVRWHSCEIKAISLLPNVLASQAAADAGAQCTILVRDGIVTEATSRSIFIVEKGRLVTYPLDGRILDSITRRIVLKLADRVGIPISERMYKVDRLFRADEVIAVGSTTEVAAVTQVDRHRIASGRPGPITSMLFDLYKRYVFKHCRKS